MSIELISKYRKELMGIAMLWIAIYHSAFPINNKLIAFVGSTCGYGGVDLFVFLSSFGLYYAYKNNNNVSRFIKRRFIRILPYSIPVTITLMFVYKYPLCETIIDCLGLSIFFRSDRLYWFTSFILFAYVITPAYLKLFNKKPLIVTICSIVIITLACFLNANDDFVYIFFRLAVYFLGFYFAYLNDNGYKNRIFNLLLIVIMIIGWFFMYYLYHYFRNDFEHVYPMVFITPGTLLLLSWIISKITFIRKPLAYIGNYTYQFYLVHEAILRVLYNNYAILYRPGIYFDVLINIVGIVLALIVAIIFKKIVDSIINAIIKQ